VETKTGANSLLEFMIKFLPGLRHSNDSHPEGDIWILVLLEQDILDVYHVKKLFTAFKNGKFVRPTDLLECFPIRKSCSHFLAALM
jgi:hypothetical protein